jgi:ferritin-like metal-binding protein YciE
VSRSTTPRPRRRRARRKEGKSRIKKTDDSVVDAVILAGALETEHYEIAVYETLVT